MSDETTRKAMGLLLPVLTGSVRSSVEGLLDEAEARGVARGVAAERARVVAALRSRAWLMGSPHVRNALLVAADRIEQGKHEKKENGNG